MHFKRSVAFLALLTLTAATGCGDNGSPAMTSTAVPTASRSPMATAVPTETSAIPTQESSRTPTATPTPLAEGFAGDLQPCRSADFWHFDVQAGDQLEVAADTRDDATAADLCFELTCGSVMEFNDDGIVCSHPAVTFDCPSLQITASESATCELMLYTCSFSCVNDALADYVLSVRRNGAQETAVLVRDNQPIFPGPTATPTPVP